LLACSSSRFQFLRFYGCILETVTQKASISNLESTVEVGEVEVGVEVEIEVIELAVELAVEVAVAVAVEVEIEPEPIRVDTKLDTSGN
jgi:hypothetical protein